VSLEELEALLIVQEHDTALDRLRHRRDAMPERAVLDARVRDTRARQAGRDEVRARHAVVQSEERRLDDEARTVGAHADDVNTRLYSGSVQSPRELQAMQADVEMLQRRRSEIEDQELEIMEQREALDSEIAALDGAIGALEADAARLREAIAVAEGEIDAEIGAETAARAAAAAPVTPALLSDYEKRRAQNRGAGAARLVGTTCQACHLTIPSTEAERIRREAGTTIAYCDNCSAILVP
jgi:predicted  nucleic acid-binding Zn-ribbon protein